MEKAGSPVLGIKPWPEPDGINVENPDKHSDDNIPSELEDSKGIENVAFAEDNDLVGEQIAESRGGNEITGSESGNINIKEEKGQRSKKNLEASLDLELEHLAPQYQLPAKPKVSINQPASENSGPLKDLEGILEHSAPRNQLPSKPEVPTNQSAPGNFDTFGNENNVTADETRQNSNDGYFVFRYKTMEEINDILKYRITDKMDISMDKITTTITPMHCSTNL